jgi:hypothetical protein
LRTIREEHKYREQLDALAISHKRLDEVMIGVSFTMARNPEEFTKVPGTNLSIARTDAYPDAPALRIFFTYNPYEVHLLFVEFAEEPENVMDEDPSA